MWPFTLNLFYSMINFQGLFLQSSRLTFRLQEKKYIFVWGDDDTGRKVVVTKIFVLKNSCIGTSLILGIELKWYKHGNIKGLPQ